MRKWVARSTRGIAAQISVLLVIATIAIGVITFAIAHETEEGQLDQAIEQERAILLASRGQPRLQAVAAAIEQRAALARQHRLFVLLVDADGRRIAGNAISTLSNHPGHRRFANTQGRVADATITAVGDGALIMGADRTDREEIDRALMTVLACGVTVVVILAIGGAWTVSAITRKRMRTIDATAQAIIDGDFARRIPRDGSDSEFDRASATLNAMLDQIEKLLTSLRQVSADVAHDLRTPLSRLRNKLEEAMAANADPVSATAIGGAIGQADDLREIFEALLRIAEVEELGARRGFEELDFSSIVRETVALYIPDAEACQHHLSVDVIDGLPVRGDRRLLVQLISNLLDNSLRHTPPGTITRVRLSATAAGPELTVEDDGPGVALHDRERIFDRFARGDASRGTPGHGFGLAIVRAIMEAHGGRVKVLDRSGFAVLLTLPLAH